MLQNKDSLMRLLKGIAKNSKDVENKVFATALLYIINEVIPEDRTTEKIVSNMEVNKK